MSQRLTVTGIALATLKMAAKPGMEVVNFIVVGRMRLTNDIGRYWNMLGSFGVVLAVSLDVETNGYFAEHAASL
jgi:hypothetical protein